MCEVKFHIKLPIFVMRQLVRHRTANINEYSGRYSIMSDEFYLPAEADVQEQSSSNNQGRGKDLDENNKMLVLGRMVAVTDQAKECYRQIASPTPLDGFYEGSKLRENLQNSFTSFQLYRMYLENSLNNFSFANYV